MTDPLLAGLRVLVVEDEAMISMMVEDQLDELGCVVVGPAASIEEALTTINSNEIDVAVLDVNLHGKHSYPVAEALARRGTRYLFTTGYGHLGLATEFKDSAVLQKPFKMDALARELGMLLHPQG